MTQLLLQYHSIGGVLTRRFTGGPPPPPSTIIRNESYDDWPLGMPTTTFWNSRMGSGAGGTPANQEDTTIVTLSGSDRVLQTFLETGKVRASTGNNGSAMICTFPYEVEEITLKYSVRFVGPFDWGGGGKILGVYGVRPGIPDSWPSGGHFGGDDGFSARVMWLTNRFYPGSVGTRANRGLAYLYGKDQTSQYGDNYFWDTATSSTASFVENAWHDVELYVKLNTVGNNNGIVRSTFDGVQVQEKTDWTARTRTDVKIKGMYWDIFFGGATPDWGPTIDENIQINDLLVTTP